MSSNRWPLFIFAVLLFTGCKEASGPKFSFASSFEKTDIDGKSQQLVRKGPNGNVYEEGQLTNGQQDGPWISYNENGFMREMTTYKNGLKNGPKFIFGERNQVEEIEHYINDKLDGVKAKYKFGRVIFETSYKNGVIDGIHREYSSKGKLQKYVEFKNGVMDGALKYYNDEGQMTLEYTYKNGEKVAGGLE